MEQQYENTFSRLIRRWEGIRYYAISDKEGSILVEGAPLPTSVDSLRQCSSERLAGGGVPYLASVHPFGGDFSLTMACSVRRA